MVRKWYSEMFGSNRTSNQILSLALQSDTVKSTLDTVKDNVTVFTGIISIFHWYAKDWMYGDEVTNIEPLFLFGKEDTKNTNHTKNPRKGKQERGDERKSNSGYGFSLEWLGY